MRTGTTWLHEMLMGHAGMPREVKEVNFFIRHYARGLRWYSNYFRGYPPALKVGEIAPNYVNSDPALARIVWRLHKLAGPGFSYKIRRQLLRFGIWQLCFADGEPHPAIDEALETRLRAQFLRQIEGLEQLIDRDLSAWELSARGRGEAGAREVGGAVAGLRG